ncbi:MAG TPA: thioredoxin domain-containing protein [Candidatus Nitrosotenuis sp.]|nr:thioredoxin domain-containing protein [Candidatus Nitrosotenuis sp.]
MGKAKKVKPSGKKSKFVGIGVVAVIAAIIGVIVASGVELGPTKTAIDTSGGSPILGSESAPVTIIEFGDYQCPFCQRWNLQTKPLIEQNYINSGKVKLVYVDLPIVGADSLKAHASSYCASEQGLYWQYHDHLYKNQGHENDGWAKPENLKELASRLDGLDAQKFSECLDSGKYEERVKENKNIAMRTGARSTPSFVIVGPDGSETRISGAQPYSVFQSAINEKLGV